MVVVIVVVVQVLTAVFSSRGGLRVREAASKLLLPTLAANLKEVIKYRCPYRAAKSVGI